MKQFKKNITEESLKIPRDVLQWVIASFTKRLEMVVKEKVVSI